MLKTKQMANGCVKQIEKLCHDVNWEDKNLYADWLAQTYYYVSHATRVLSKAASICTLEQEPLHKAFLKSINEEKNHEILALNDLTKLGTSIDHFPEHVETSAYYQALYYLMDYHGPFALVGYFLPLEGLGAIGSGELYDRIMNAHGAKAASFVQVHAKADVSHYDDGLDILNGLNAEQLKIVQRSLFLSTELYCNILQKVIRNSHRSSKRIVA